jgi:hypothetical protein
MATIQKANSNIQQQNDTGLVQCSQPTLDKANKVRLTIENYYENLFHEVEEREERYRKLEENMRQQGLGEAEVHVAFESISFVRMTVSFEFFHFEESRTPSLACHERKRIFTSETS